MLLLMRMPMATPRTRTLMADAHAHATLTRMITAVTPIMITPAMLTRMHSTATTTSTAPLAAVIITATITTTMLRPGAMPMRPSRKNSPVRAAGSADCPPSSPSGCGRVPARSWFWFLRWHRDCSGPVSPRPSSWGSAPRSPLLRSPHSPSVRAGLRNDLRAARPGPGMLVLRGLEVAAALLVLVFGIALLFGYIASERMFA